VFIVLAIMALAGVPIYTSRLITSEEVRVSEVLEPAQRLAADLALVQARQMLRFREYLLTGDTDAKVRYQALLPEEEALREDLFALLDRMDEGTRLRALPLVDASLEWHLGHRIALDGDVARLEFLPLADEDQTRYESMLLNSLSFREGINEAMEAGRRAAEDARRLQLRLTIGLLALTLLATVAVALVGRRLRGIIAEANLRRRDAVRARWEIDAILEATGDGVLGVDLDGRLLTLNATGARMLGFREEEARGRSVHDLLHGSAQADDQHAPEACPLLQALRQEAAAERVDDVLWHRRGSAVPVRWALRPLMDGRIVRGAVVTVTDMTQIREAESALRQAVRARDETMAVVSHDLRNPLGSIMAAAELLLDVPLDEEKSRKQLRTIQKAAERSNLLIDDLLDVARIDAGVLSVRATACPVRPLLDETVSLISPQALDKGIVVLVRVPGDVLRVHADRNRMLQVLGNLLGNALRHTASGGEIRLAAARRGEEQVVISVTDSGQGIGPEDQLRLFDRFWRQDRTSRSGAGLGLAIVKGIVEAHGGIVEVESEVGQGSTFSVVLPVHARAAVSLEPTADSDS
jgi:PAS domain S-box-containing protein